MKRYLILIAVLTLFINCKSRKVLITKIDSVTISSVDKLTHTEESHIDTTNIKTQKNIIAYDSSRVKIVITPVAGKQIKIDKNGTFVGEALKVEVVNKKQISTNQTEFANMYKVINDKKLANTSLTKKQQISVSKKIKSIYSKPNYSWLWWISIWLVVVIFLYQLYKKIWPIY